MSLLKQLTRLGSYRYGSTRLRNGRSVPYVIRFPQDIDADFFDVLVCQVKTVCSGTTWVLPRVIGIAESGIPLAWAVWEGLRQSGTDPRFAIINPHDEQWSITPGRSGETPLLVDNAVTTGKTIQWACQKLAEQHLVPRTAIRLFDREEIEQSGFSLAEDLERQLGVTLWSLFRIRDLLPELPVDQRHEILNHLVQWGNPSVRRYVEETYVFTNGAWSIRAQGTPRIG